MESSATAERNEIKVRPLWADINFNNANILNLKKTKTNRVEKCREKFVEMIVEDRVLGCFAKRVSMGEVTESR